MSSNTDDLGNAKVDLPDGSALFALPHDPNAAATHILQDIGKKTAAQVEDTPDPTSDEGNQTIDPHQDGGPLRRFNEIKSPLGSIGLESLAKDEDEIAKAISARSDETYRNEFPVIVPKFELRCTECGAEFEDENVEECEICGNDDFESPDPQERRTIKQRFEHVNKEGQSMRQVGKITDEDHSRLGTMCWVLRWTYITAPRQTSPEITDARRVIDVQWDELVRGDPKRIVPVVDANGRVGGVWWTCPLHREGSLTKRRDVEQGHQHCPTCGCDLREVHYVEREGAAHDDIQKYYFEHEIVMHAGHIPQPHGLDGLSPVHLVWLEQAILHWMDVYAAEYFNPHSEKTPGKFVIFHTTNKESLEREIEGVKEDMQANPQKGRSMPTILYDEMIATQNTESGVEIVDVIDNEFLGQSEELRKRYENHIRTVFGVTDVFDSELEDAGGLNNEGLQLEVTDRSIAAAHQDYEDGPYDELLRYWGFDDWAVRFVPPREQDLDEQRQAVKLLREAAEIGLPARMENGEPVVGDGEAEAPQQAGPPGPGDDGGGGLEPISRDEAEEEFGADTGNSNSGAGMKQSSVPDEAVNIDDPSEAPEDAQLFEGPRGGLYYVPQGGSGGESDGTPGDPFDEPPEEVFGDFNGEEGRETVSNLTQTWTGWPTDSDTAPMWHAAASVTDNENDPDNISGIPMLENEADPEAVAAYEEYHDHLTERLREEHGDTITTHRFLHSEAADALRDGDSLQPRTLSSWTTNVEQIPDLVNQIPTPEGDFADPEDAVVVTQEIPVENVFDHHAGNPVLDDAEQEEVIVGMDWDADLSDGEVRTVAELADEEQAPPPEAAATMKQSDVREDYPTILLGYDFEPIGSNADGGTSTQNVDNPDEPLEVLTEAQKHLTWTEKDVGEIGQKAREPFWSEDGDVPEFAKEAIRQALKSGAIRAISEKLPAGTTQRDVESYFEEKLSQPQGWSLRSLAEGYADRFDVDMEDAFRNVRRQTKGILDTAREEGYRDQMDDPDGDESLFKWIGPIDDDKTDASLEILAKTNPDHGGTPRPLDELKQIVADARSKHFPKLTGAEWADGWQDRDTFVEHFD